MIEAGPFLRFCRHMSPFTRFLKVFVFVYFLCGVLSALAADELKVLTIGNSFADNATRYLVQAAQSAGKKVTLFRANLGGHSLEQHARYLAAHRANPEEGRKYRGPQGERISLVEALRLQPWDVVTIQQVSTQSFRPETFEPYATELIAAVREFAPQAAIWVHETWEYHPDYLARRKQTDMYEKLHQAYLELAQRHGLKIIPVGTAFHAALNEGGWKPIPDPDFDYQNPPPGVTPREKRGLHVGWQWRKNRASGDPQFSFDFKHANDAGCYLGASVFLFTLFPDVKDFPFVPQTLSADEAAELRAIARSVVNP